MGVKHGSHVSDCQIIFDEVLAGFEVHFDLRETSHEGVSQTIARHRVASNGQQSLTGQRGSRSRRHFVDTLGQLVAIVYAPEFDRPLGSLRQTHAGAAALTEY